MAAHAFSVLDSYIYGFVLQESSLPFSTADEVVEVAASMLPRAPAAEYPHFTEILTEFALKPGYSYGAEFEFGLELILDGLERTRSAG